MEHLPEKLDGGMVSPVLSFVLSTLKSINKKIFLQLVFLYVGVGEMTSINRDLFELRPVVVGVSDDHGLQLVRLEELQNFPSAHFVEACVEALEQRCY